ncbi:MAG: response regulator transcription factor [Fidelibacterota bacterium]
MTVSIAIIDDEPDIVELVTHHLNKEGYNTHCFYNGESFINFLSTDIPDIIILDLMLPGIDGLEICRVLKKDERTAGVPVLILSARGTETDIVVGLELGADDYIVKPFSPRELIARVRAILRRVKSRGIEEKFIRVGDIFIDLGKFEVRIKDKKVDLTPTEFNILKILAGDGFSQEISY